MSHRHCIFTRDPLSHVLDYWLEKINPVIDRSLLMPDNFKFSTVASPRTKQLKRILLELDDNLWEYHYLGKYIICF